MPTWETATDWDNATAESGVEHESVTNTANDDATRVEQGYTYTGYEVTPEPLAHYPLQETSGSTANDVAGSNDATINGATPDGATGPLGVPASSFDGTGDIVDLPSFSQFSALSVVMWAYHTNNSDNEAVISIRVNNDFAMYTNADFVPAARAELGGDLVNGPELATGRWYHLAATWDGSTLEFYIDGQSEGTTSASNGSKGEGSALGRFSNAGGFERYFSGGMSDVRIYDRALSASEVQTLYDVVAAQSSLTTATKSL